MYKVYLSGPITGLTYDAGNDWRLSVTRGLECRGSKIKCLNPMRAHEFLRDYGVIGDKHAQDTDKGFLVTDEFIGIRDHWDTVRADAVFVNLLEATRISVGTVLEIGMAHAKRVPVILVMQDENVHNHPMIRNYTSLRFTDLKKAVLATRALFCV